jgi:hypothetical protein
MDESGTSIFKKEQIPLLPIGINKEPGDAKINWTVDTAYSLFLWR